MAAVAPDGFDVVILELEGGFHCFVGLEPIAKLVFEIVAAVLHEDANVLLDSRTNEARITVAASNVSKAAEVAHDFAEQVGPFPGDCEGADGAGRKAANGPAGGVRAEIILLADFGQDFFLQELG